MKNVLIFVDLFSLMAISFFFVFILSLETSEEIQAKHNPNRGVLKDTTVWMINLTDGSQNELIGNGIELDIDYSNFKQDETVFVGYVSENTYYVIQTQPPVSETLKPLVYIKNLTDISLLNREIQVTVINMNNSKPIHKTIVIGGWVDFELSSPD